MNITRISLTLQFSIDQAPSIERSLASSRLQVPEYDFFISASAEQIGSVKEVQDIFKRHKANVKFYTQKSSNSNDENQIFDSMKKCSRYTNILYDNS